MDLLFLVTDNSLIGKAESIPFLSHYYVSLFILVIKREEDLSSNFEVVEASVSLVFQFVFHTLQIHLKHIYLFCLVCLYTQLITIFDFGLCVLWIVTDVLSCGPIEWVLPSYCLAIFRFGN